VKEVFTAEGPSLAGEGGSERPTVSPSAGISQFIDFQGPASSLSEREKSYLHPVRGSGGGVPGEVSDSISMETGGACSAVLPALGRPSRVGQEPAAASSSGGE